MNESRTKLQDQAGAIELIKGWDLAAQFADERNLYVRD
jgi:hypothetical protein